MRAIVHDRYGGPERLEQRDIATPTIGDDEVLVRVRAAALHPGDAFALRGSPFPVRAMSGWFGPKHGIPGFDLAGVVAAVGRRATRFSVGDDVFGIGNGTLAEFSRAAERDLQPKPVCLTFEQAASIPTSALAALHGLRDAGHLEAGQRVLINGASGGVGTFAIQIARAMGAHVTGVCGPTNVELVRSIGAHEVIDYTREDFTALGSRYDLILDNIENRSLGEVRRALRPTGTLVLNSGTGAGGLRLLVRLIAPLLISPFVRQTLRRYLSNPRPEDLAHLRELVEAGTIRPVIDRTFPLGEAAAAMRQVESGHARGKVVVAVGA